MGYILQGQFLSYALFFQITQYSATKSQNTKYCINGLLRHIQDRQLIPAMFISFVLIAVLLILIFKRKYHFRHYFKAVLNNYLKRARDQRHIQEHLSSGLILLQHIQAAESRRQQLWLSKSVYCLNSVTERSQEQINPFSGKSNLQDLFHPELKI